METRETCKTRTCEKCSVQVPLDKVRLYPRDAEKNWLVCESCCERLKSNSQTKASNLLPKKDLIKNVAKPLLAKPPISITQKKPEQKNNSDYRTLFCTRCKYYFKVDDRKGGVYNKIVCPYCGKEDRLGVR